MFYVCSQNGNKYGIIDTRDGKVEFYTYSQIKKFGASARDIAGLFGFSEIFVLNETLAKLWFCPMGKPLRIKMSDTLDWVQAIYFGFTSEGGNLIFRFYDGGGVTGMFNFTSVFLISSNVLIDFDNNDAVKVATLLRGISFH